MQQPQLSQTPRIIIIIITTTTTTTTTTTNYNGVVTRWLEAFPHISTDPRPHALSSSLIF
jgi:hypothetical protein